MSVVDLGQRARTPTKDAIRRFLGYTQRFSSNTQRQYRDGLWRFCDAMPDFVELITAEHINRYVCSRRILNSSKNAMLTPIRSFFRYLSDYYDIPNVANKVKCLKNQPPRQRVISEFEYRKILEVAKPIEGAVIRFLANSGLRATEMAILTPANISPNQKYLTIVGKGDKRRLVPLNDTCRECLNLIFSKSFTRDTLYNLCRSLSRRARLSSVAGPHSYRHFFCTRLIRKGVAITKVSKIMGHASVAVTERIYLHLLPVDFLGVTDCLDI